jgi:hypothetical protein
VTRPSEGFTYSPVAFLTSVLARNSSASRLVLKPRFLVWEPVGVRYRTEYRGPASMV